MIQSFKWFFPSLQLAFFVLVMCGAGSARADPNGSGTDEIFGGQILSLTAEKPELEPSNDPR
ncbi:MAG TPA: hypothetical protein EYF96_01650, partial [Nitrospinaceae bacterium]|nr:hypothetical protein [Nitrospinaceae bacterium]